MKGKILLVGLLFSMNSFSMWRSPSILKQLKNMGEKLATCQKVKRKIVAFIPQRIKDLSFSQKALGVGGTCVLGSWMLPDSNSRLIASNEQVAQALNRQAQAQEESNALLRKALSGQ